MSVLFRRSIHEVASIRSRQTRIRLALRILTTWIARPVCPGDWSMPWHLKQLYATCSSQLVNIGRLTLRRVLEGAVSIHVTRSKPRRSRS
jgi:hypothetical protein